MPDRMITVVGDTVDLYVETDVTIQPGVEVDFQSVPVKSSQNQTTPPANISFTESLTAVPAPLRDPPNARGLLASRIKWKVNLKKDPVLEARTAVLVARVRGRSVETGRLVTASVRDLLFVRAIDVTTDTKLTRIMLHEFAKADGGSFVFDPKPAEDFLATLSVEQKKLLLKIAEANPRGRLAVFVTFYDSARKGLRMFADNGGGQNAIRPNATFTVFHCRDVEQGGVTLVCHTEHFVVHMGNGDTQNWILSRQGPKKQLANDYMKKTNPEPLEYRLVAHLPAGADGHDGVIWSSPFRLDGKSIMPGNFIHGVINTLGCWMLFQNYNWPKSVASSFDRVYRLWRRLDDKRPATFRGSPTVLRALEAVTDPGGGKYDFSNDPAVPPAGQSSSFQKFIALDKNFAHLWFYHEVVGIKYFSTTLTHTAKRYVRDRNFKFINDRNTHALSFENTFPLASAGVAPPFNLPEEGSFAAYDPQDRQTETRGFTPDDSLWRDNALGFRASAGFVPSFARSVTPGEVRAKSWADLFFYKEDDVDLGPRSRAVRAEAVFIPGT